jgi:type II secretory pathway component PulF
MQQAISQFMAEAIKALPRPKVPHWMEAIADFVKFHPWFSLFIFIFVMLVISAIIREVICSYLKTNDILIRLKRIEEKLK